MAKKSKTKTTKKLPKEKKTPAAKAKSSSKKPANKKATKSTAKTKKTVSKQKPKKVQPTKAAIVIEPSSSAVPVSTTKASRAPVAAKKQGSSYLPRVVEFLLLLVIFALAISLVVTEYALSPKSGEQQAVATQPWQVTSVDGKYLFTGTVVWDRNIEEWSKDSDGAINPAQPFSGLASYDPNQYNAWFTDLECPTSTEDIPYELGLTTLEFNCRQEYLPEAAKYFQFMNLANNHSGNSGQEKLEETRQALAANNIQYFGDPDPGRTDDTCQVIELPVTVWQSRGGPSTPRDGSLPIAACAWHYFLRLPLSGELEEIQKYVGVMPVFAFLHMGAEYQETAGLAQQETARRLIDLGADFVIANNPHWVQNAESYKGKLIVYSTGNFIFDQTWSDEVRSSVSVAASMEFSSDSGLEPWLELGSQCEDYNDTCLEKAYSLNPLGARYKHDVIAGTIEKFGAQTKADERIQAFVEDRLGWNEVSALLEN